MEDELHNHLTIGYQADCGACALVEAVFNRP